MAKSNNASLIIVHVYVAFTPGVPEEYMDPTIWDRIDTDARRWSQRQLATLVTRARARGAKASGVMVEGDPADGIIRVARSKRADLIVMGTHGRRGISRVLMGSVAARVVAGAPCPVMTVRARTESKR
jgi:nucleotide-binding universal stress UspA family protein